jgi:hypothetical protein
MEMKKKLSGILLILGVVLFLMSGLNFFVDFMPQGAVPATGVIALVCVGSGARMGRRS